MEINVNVQKKISREEYLVRTMKEINKINMELCEKEQLIIEKVNFYKTLPINNDFDRGFNKAFEIMDMLLKGGNKNDR